MSDKAAAELIGTAILLFTIQVSIGQNAAFAPMPSVEFGRYYFYRRVSGVTIRT